MVTRKKKGKKKEVSIETANGIDPRVCVGVTKYREFTAMIFRLFCFGNSAAFVCLNSEKKIRHILRIVHFLIMRLSFQSAIQITRDSAGK